MTSLDNLNSIYDTHIYTEPVYVLNNSNSSFMINKVSKTPPPLPLRRSKTWVANKNCSTQSLSNLRNRHYLNISTDTLNSIRNINIEPNSHFGLSNQRHLKRTISCDPLNNSDIYESLSDFAELPQNRSFILAKNVKQDKIFLSNDNIAQNSIYLNRVSNESRKKPKPKNLNQKAVVKRSSSLNSNSKNSKKNNHQNINKNLNPKSSQIKLKRSVSLDASAPEINSSNKKILKHSPSKKEVKFAPGTKPSEDKLKPGNVSLKDIPNLHSKKACFLTKKNLAFMPLPLCLDLMKLEDNNMEPVYDSYVPFPQPSDGEIYGEDYMDLQIKIHELKFKSKPEKIIHYEIHEETIGEENRNIYDLPSDSFRNAADSINGNKILNEGHYTEIVETKDNGMMKLPKIESGKQMLQEVNKEIKSLLEKKTKKHKNDNTSSESINIIPISEVKQISPITLTTPTQAIQSKTVCIAMAHRSSQISVSTPTTPIKGGQEFSNTHKLSPLSKVGAKYPSNDPIADLFHSRYDFSNDDEEDLVDSADELDPNDDKLHYLSMSLKTNEKPEYLSMSPVDNPSTDYLPMSSPEKSSSSEYLSMSVLETESVDYISMSSIGDNVSDDENINISHDDYVNVEYVPMPLINAEIADYLPMYQGNDSSICTYCIDN